ncbi:MAG: hypothetical protein ACMG6E_03790, partial [Candidatus Roizmanbacteria bacterium]
MYHDKRLFMARVTVANIQSKSSSKASDDSAKEFTLTGIEPPDIEVAALRIVAAKNLQMWYDLNTGSLFSDEAAKLLIDRGERVSEPTNKLLARSKAEQKIFISALKADFATRFFIAPKDERILQPKEVGYKITLLPLAKSAGRNKLQAPPKSEWLEIGKAVVKFGTTFGRILK